MSEMEYKELRKDFCPNGAEIIPYTTECVCTEPDREINWELRECVEKTE